MSENWEFINPLVGGVLIGVASSLMLLFHGRIAGISGILGGVLGPWNRAEGLWRLVFLAGLLLAGFALTFLLPERFPNEPIRSLGTIAIAGVIVGFGTRLGSGCTSGHGVCGMSRLSVRSITATLVFMGTGALTVLLARMVLS
ncbi:MAG: YeeE/YedE family protein [Myxococcota bacterium]